jgi:methyl coenzyme M reductase beta subunit
MRTKLTRQEFNALADVIKAMVQMLPTDDLEDKLLRAMMERLMIEMEQRRVVVQKEYKLNWHPERAMAFAIVVSRCQFKTDSYEGNLCRTLYNQIIQSINL